MPEEYPRFKRLRGYFHFFCPRVRLFDYADVLSLHPSVHWWVGWVGVYQHEHGNRSFPGGSNGVTTPHAPLPGTDRVWTTRSVVGVGVGKGAVDEPRTQRKEEVPQVTPNPTGSSPS